jgi:large subunit ribosomal protein L9
MSIKVILLEEVVNLGEPGKIVDVAPGYARNFLVPRKLATYANEGKLKELAHNTKRLERKRAKLQTAAQTVADSINEKTLTIDVRAGLDGKLFGSVTTKDIADALKQQLNVEVDRRKVHLSEPIRTLGTHIISVHLLTEARASINVHVMDSTHPFDAPVAVEVAAAPVAEVAEVAEESAE